MYFDNTSSLVAETSFLMRQSFRFERGKRNGEGRSRGRSRVRVEEERGGEEE